MSRPRILHVEKIGEKVDRARLHEMAAKFAELAYAAKGTTAFVFLVACDTDVIWIETPWEDDREKTMTVTLLSTTMKTFGAHAYASVIEAWLAKYDSEADVDRLGMPSDRPAHERQDVVLIASADLDGHSQFTTFPVTMKDDGTGTLGAREDDKPDHASGLFTNLLKPRG